MDTVLRPQCECRKCGFVWVANTEDLPMRCANQKCRTPYWNSVPCVYVMTRPNGVYKVGATINILQRYQSKDARTGIVCTIPCSAVSLSRIERQVHQLLSTKRVDHELFRLDDADLADLHSIAESGDASARLNELVGKQPDATMESAKCKDCGFEWLPRVPEPQKCPKCGSREWREPKGQQEKQP